LNVLRSTKHNRRNGPRQRIKQALVLLACLSSSAYFAYHAKYGRHGLDARATLKEHAMLLDFELKGLVTVRSKLERDCALLSPEIPDPDLVEEIARDVLGYVRADEKIVALQ